jgi:hypothetical protein
MYETMLVLSVVLFIGTTIVYLRDPSASAFHPVTFYLLFHGLVFVARPISSWYYEFNQIYDAMRFTPSITDKVEALVCTNLALVVFVAVCLFLIREPLHFKQNNYDLAQRRMLSERFVVVALVLGAIAAYSIYWTLDFMQTEESFSEQDMRTGARVMTATNGYFYAAGWMLATIVAVIAYLGRFKLWAFAPFLAFAAFRFAAGQRGAVVAALVMMALLYMYDKRRKWPTFAVVLAIIPAVLAFDAIQADRGLALREAFGFEISDVDRRRYAVVREERFLETMDLGMLEMVEFLTWSVPEKTGSYDYFVSNLQVLTEPIPRALWPDKPSGAPIKMFDLYSHAVTVNGVMSVPGMGWMYWGYPGVIIWAAVFALIYGSAYKAFALSRHSNVAVIAYMIFLSTAVVAFRDGLILTILKQVLFYMAPLVALILVARSTRLPSADELRRLWIERDLEAKGLPNAPHGRRAAALIAGTESQAPAVNTRASEPVSLTPRDRRRAKMADLA